LKIKLWRLKRKKKMIIREIAGIQKLQAGGGGHILFVGQTGTGKTLAVERTQEEEHKTGKLMVIIENAKSNLESGFCNLTLQERYKYHLDKLKFQGETPQKKDIKIYHLNNNIPTYKKIPETKIWTMNIKHIDRLLTSYLFEESSESSSISILNTAIERLKDNEGFFDLFMKLKKGDIKAEKDLFSLESKASSINFNTILNYLSRFRDQAILMPNNYEKNLDIVKELGEQKPYHIFSNRYIADSKVRDLATLYLLNEIRKAKAQGLIKREIVIVLDELKTLAPNNPLFNHQKILSKLLTEILSVCRSLGITIIGATQLYGEIDSGVRQSFSEVLLGRTTALSELKEISSIVGFDYSMRQMIMELEFNQFTFLSQEYNRMGTWHFHLPRHAHAERNLVFDRLFEKEYPDKMKNYKDEVKDIMSNFKMQEERVRGSL